jgi:hypothetical protein
MQPTGTPERGQQIGLGPGEWECGTVKLPNPGQLTAFFKPHIVVRNVNNWTVYDIMYIWSKFF